MTDLSAEALNRRLTELQAKRRARDGQPGMTANVKAIDAAIAEIQAALTGLNESAE